MTVGKKGKSGRDDMRREEVPAQRGSEVFQKERRAEVKDLDAQAREAAAISTAGKSKSALAKLDDSVLETVAETAFEFCMKSTGMTLYPYQQELGRRLCRSLIMGDQAEITALFARQSGKTETASVVITGLMVLLPVLADSIPDPRIQKFKNGFHVGVFGPSYNSVSIISTRLRDRMYSSGMKEVMQDPEIALNPETDSLRLPNGSFVRGHSTNPKVHIEGGTFHLLLCDESQDISDLRLRKSIHPMAAATGGTILKMGTPCPRRCEFHDACQRNRRNDLALKNKKDCRHFEFDYRYCAEYNPQYDKYIKEEIERLGFESDDFRMSYRLHWIMERGQFLSPEQLTECAIDRQADLKVIDDRTKKPIVFRRSSNVVTFDSTNRHVAAVDIGRSHDSTVITVGKVFWDSPQKVGEREMFPVHVSNWMEIHGDNHEAQYPQIVQFLKNYRLDNVLVDATGRGDPVYERLAADLEQYDVPVTPFVFSQQSKHIGYSLLLQELQTRRLTYPAGAAVRRLAKYRRFVQQFYDLEKSWRGKYMSVAAPKGRDAHDDYPDSLMLLIMATQKNRHTTREVEVMANPFFDHRRRGLRDAQAWWRG